MAPKRPENAREWLARWEKRRQKAFDNYQSTGIQRYDDYEDECSVVCEALRAYIERQSERTEDTCRRMTNRDWAIDKLVKGTYTRAEVVKMLHDAVYW